MTMTEPASTAAATAGPVWRRGDFPKLWLGQSVSLLGDQITLLVLPVLAALTLRASVAEVAGITVAARLPFLVIGLPVGAWVDRWDKRRVLICADAVRFAAAAAIPAGVALQRLTMPLVLAAVLISGVATVFFQVAYTSYLPFLVTQRGHLGTGNMLLVLSESLSLAVGPGLAGIMISWLGVGDALLLDAGTCAVSVGTLLAIRSRVVSKPLRSAPSRGLYRDVAEGLRFVITHPVLRPIAFCSGWYVLFFIITESLLVLYGLRSLHMTPAMIGLALAAGGAGMPVGNLVGRWLAEQLGLGRALLLSAVVAVSGPLFFPLAPAHGAMPWLIAGSVLSGLGQGSYNVNSITTRQLLTPPELLGRMSAVFRFVVWGAMPLGSAVAGAVGGNLGLRNAMAVGAAGQVLCVPFLLSRGLLRTAPGQGRRAVAP